MKTENHNSDKIKDDGNSSIRNYKLYDLEKTDNLSIWTYNICIQNGWDGLEKIFEYYYKKKTFKKVRDCGAKSNKELLRLIEKYKTYFPELIAKADDAPPLLLPPYTLDDLVVFEKLSVRAVSICNAEGLTDLEKIYHYYLANHDFLRIRNSGKSTNEEIVNMLIKYESIAESKAKTTPVASAEVQAAMRIYEEKCLQFQRVFQFDLPSRIENFKELYLSNSLPIFSIIKVLLKESLYLDSVEKEIIRNLKNGVQKHLSEIGDIVDLTRERVRQKKEKLSKKLFRDGSPIRVTLNTLLDHADQSLIKFSGDIFILDIDTIDKINQQNKTNYKPLFIAQVVSILYPEYHLLNYQFYELDAVKQLFSDKKPTIDLKNFYFIQKKYDIIFIENFIKLFWEVLYEGKGETGFFSKHKILHTCILPYRKAYNSIARNCKAHIEQRNRNRDTQNDVQKEKEKRKWVELINQERAKLTNKFEDYFKIYIKIADSEFGLPLVNNGFQLEKKINKKKYDYVIDVLNAFGRPMHLTELLEEVNKIKPGLFEDEKALRAACQSHDCFIAFSHYNTYGLKKWEKENKNIKGGSVTEIVYEFLCKSNKPKHIRDITKHVNKYRKISELSIRGCLKLARHHHFVFDGKGMVSLGKEFGGNNKVD